MWWCVVGTEQARCGDVLLARLCGWSKCYNQTVWVSVAGSAGCCSWTSWSVSNQTAKSQVLKLELNLHACWNLSNSQCTGFVLVLWRMLCYCLKCWGWEVFPSFFSFHKLQNADNIFLFHYVANSSYRVCSTAAFDEGTETGKIPVLCVSMQVQKWSDQVPPCCLILLFPGNVVSCM